MQPDPALAMIVSAALVSAVAWTMVATAAKKRMIELRGARKRICPSCGRTIPGRVCKRH